jgi:hypothetical protein
VPVVRLTPQSNSLVFPICSGVPTSAQKKGTCWAAISILLCHNWDLEAVRCSGVCEREMDSWLLLVFWQYRFIGCRVLKTVRTGPVRVKSRRSAGRDGPRSMVHYGPHETGLGGPNSKKFNSSHH